MALIDYTTLASGALAFTVALAWNDAVSKTIKGLVPQNERASTRLSLLYAAVVTLLVIVVALLYNHTHRFVRRHWPSGDTCAPDASRAASRSYDVTPAAQRANAFQSRSPAASTVVRLWRPSAATHA